MTPAIIDLHTLPSLPLDQRNHLPDTAGVYFVIAPNDAVLYVGQSVSLVRRWASHHRIGDAQRVGQCRIAWLSVTDTVTLDEVERTCIAQFEPALNGTAVDAEHKMTAFRLPDDLRSDINQYAADNGLSANAATIHLLRLGLDAEGRAFLERHGPVIRAEVEKMLAARDLSDAAT